MVRELFCNITVLLMAVWLVGCNSDDGGQIDSGKPKAFEKISFTNVEMDMVSRTQSFDWELLKAVDKNTSGNFMISPISAVLDLSMLANGADGETLQQILDALHVDADDIGSLNAYSKKLMDGITAVDNTTDIQIANAMFVAPGFDVYDEVKQYLKTWYQADVLPIGVDNSGQINSWVANKTKNRITGIIDPAEESKAKYAVANALYFDAIWQSPFSVSATIEDTFYAPNGRRTAKFMCKRKAVELWQNDELAMVRLDFGNRAFSIYFVLPHEDVALDEALPRLDYSVLSGCQFDAFTLNLRVPKFKMASRIDLPAPLKECGIVDAFDSNADFSNFSGEKTMINIMRQSCTFEIDEAGVKAAASTVASGTVTAAPPIKDGGDFFLNRPFLFLIKENSSNACLFIGKVEDL